MSCTKSSDSSKGACYSFAEAVSACVSAHSCLLDCVGDDGLNALSWGAYVQFNTGATAICTALNAVDGSDQTRSYPRDCDGLQRSQLRHRGRTQFLPFLLARHVREQRGVH